jgi:hypothetical protein
MRKSPQRLKIGAVLLLTLGLQFVAAERGWSEPPKSPILFTERQESQTSTFNDPETGAPRTLTTEAGFVDIGKVVDVIFDPSESWVLDLKLSSGETRYLVFYGYNPRYKDGIELSVAPERAAIFKKAITEARGDFQLVQSGSFDSLVRSFGRGRYDEYHGDEQSPKRVYIPSIDVHIKDYRTNSWTSIDEYIEAARKADESAAKTGARSSLTLPAGPVLQNLRRFMAEDVAAGASDGL